MENNQIKLSILIPTLVSRSLMLKRLMDCLLPQLNDQVEVLIETDNRELSTGTKRNKLLNRSIGEYVTFIDDDDLVSEDYIKLIFEGINKKVDVIGISMIFTRNGKNPQTSIHSIKYKKWSSGVDPDNPSKTIYYRSPSHTNPIRSELAIKQVFPNITRGEDSEYSKKILKHLKTEHFIIKPIYYYLKT